MAWRSEVFLGALADTPLEVLPGTNKRPRYTSLRPVSEVAESCTHPLGTATRATRQAEDINRSPVPQFFTRWRAEFSCLRPPQEGSVLHARDRATDELVSAYGATRSRRYVCAVCNAPVRLPERARSRQPHFAHASWPRGPRLQAVLPGASRADRKTCATSGPGLRRAGAPSWMHSGLRIDRAWSKIGIFAARLP